jgi:homeobox protein cut-like
LFPQRGEDLETGFGSDVESKYKKIYEEDINPFVAFSKKVNWMRVIQLTSQCFTVF